MSYGDQEQVAKVAAALSDPIRLRILEILVRGRDASCVSTPHPELPNALCPYLDVLPKLEDISPSKLSYHLRELRAAGLLEERRQGKQVFCLVNRAALERFLEEVRASFLEVTPAGS